MELVMQIQKIASDTWYLYSPRDSFVHLLIFNKMWVKTLKQKYLINKWCERYDKNDYLCLHDTSKEVFVDLWILDEYGI